jgi:hypothetical protein
VLLQLDPVCGAHVQDRDIAFEVVKLVVRYAGHEVTLLGCGTSARVLVGLPLQQDLGPRCSGPVAFVLADGRLAHFSLNPVKSKDVFFEILGDMIGYTQ